MEIIRVPATPKEAFNKHRPMSDLIKAQIRHLKHLEEKLSPEVRATLPQHRLITEDDAARYIAPMTAFLRSQSAAAPPQTAKAPVEIKRPLPARPAKGIAIAAVAESKKKTSSKKKAPAVARPSSSKSKTGKSSRKKK